MFMPELCKQISKSKVGTMKTILSVISVLSFFALSAHAQYPSLSRTICESHSIYVSNAIEYRRQGMPINIALSTIRSTMDNQYLYLILRVSIEAAYSDPLAMEPIVRSGRWVDFCESSLLNPNEFKRIMGL